MGPNDILRLSPCPSVLLKTDDSSLFGSFSGSIYDPCLASISCFDEFGEKVSLILNRMPPRDHHNFVSLIQ
eukprot:2511896-Ditylum_brightwellii.AAC.1